MRVRHHLLCQGTTKICATIVWQYSGGAQGAEHHRTVIPVVPRMSFPRVKVPPLKKCPNRLPGRELSEFLSAYCMCVQKRTHKASRISGQTEFLLLTVAPTREDVRGGHRNSPKKKNELSVWSNGAARPLPFQSLLFRTYTVELSSGPK